MLWTAATRTQGGVDGDLCLRRLGVPCSEGVSGKWLRYACRCRCRCCSGCGTVGQGRTLQCACKTCSAAGACPASGGGAKHGKGSAGACVAAGCSSGVSITSAVDGHHLALRQLALAVRIVLRMTYR